MYPAHRPLARGPPLSRTARPSPSTLIQADQIVAENMVSGVQVVYRLQPVDLPPPVADWEGHYLRTLISRCDPLDLTSIDPAQPLDAEPVHVSDVFTTLLLESRRRAPDQPVSEALRSQGSCPTPI